MGRDERQVAYFRPAEVLVACSEVGVSQEAVSPLLLLSSCRRWRRSFARPGSENPVR
jgi:hypothetical protein